MTTTIPTRRTVEKVDADLRLASVAQTVALVHGNLASYDSLAERIDRLLDERLNLTAVLRAIHAVTS